MKLANHLNLAPRLRIYGGLYLHHPFMPLWNVRVLNQIHLSSPISILRHVCAPAACIKRSGCPYTSGQSKRILLDTSSPKYRPEFLPQYIISFHSLPPLTCPSTHNTPFNLAAPKVSYLQQCCGIATVCRAEHSVQSTVCSTERLP